ncbi:MAG: family 2 glycosyl transferase [Candidatus Peregrinibacteria bacterium Greene1014_49]|nr:MAG: family 2 glycosyl transferase [Candidatus Peregrinibacteria bacterium Greene1014_49]
MYNLWSLVEPLLDAAEAKNVVEIGSFEAENTRHLLHRARRTKGIVHAVDPFPKFHTGDAEREYGPFIAIHQKKSLDVIPDLCPCDAVLIDGDHTWYTVINELRLLHKHSVLHGQMPLILLHDVGWPYGRRDCYQIDEDIPKEYRHPHAFKGLVMGQSYVTDVPWALHSNCDNALYEGGPHNGVLTAVEDFLKEIGSEWSFTDIPGFYGLGILLHEKTARAFPALASLVKSLQLPIPLREHLLSLERIRFSCYTEINRLEWELKNTSAQEQSVCPPTPSEREIAAVAMEQSGS